MYWFQRMQLDIILASLQDNSHVASLLGFGNPADMCMSQPGRGHQTDTQLAQILMKTLLRNLAFHTVRDHRLSGGYSYGAIK